MNLPHICRLGAIYTWFPAFKDVPFWLFCHFSDTSNYINYIFHVKSVMFMFEKQTVDK